MGVQRIADDLHFRVNMMFGRQIFRNFILSCIP
jgi:hypothetical protein